MNKQIKSGIAALIGKPNVGKSTLLNYVTGRKIAIVSNKPQTTRQKILGVKTTNDYQIVFADTPGFYKSLHLLGQKMQKVSRAECRQADLICFIVQANDLPSDDDLKAADFIFKVKKKPPVFLVINKIDLVEKDELFKKVEIYKKLGNFAEIITISSKTGENVKNLIERIIKYLPEGPLYFPPGYFTDKDQKFLISELIREKAINLTRQEIPHCIAVDIEDIREGKTPDYIYVYAVIYVEKDSQKGIVIGKSGQLLKKIGTQSRIEIEELLKKKVFLELRVKTKTDWREREDFLRALGYE